MTEITEAVERPAGHCKDEAAWAEFRDRYLPMARERLSCGDMTDFELANHVFMVDRSDLGLIVAQTAAKDRIRWLSVQLAEKTAEATRLQEEVKGLRAALRFCQAEAIEGSNDLDDPITAKWDCSAPNLPIITRNVARFVDIYNAGKAVIGEYEMTDAELEEFRLKVATLQGQQS